MAQIDDRTRRQERGAAAVEFAIIMPVLFLLVAGIIDLGRAFFTQIQLANAAREGVRIAVVAADDADVHTQVQIRAAATAPSTENMVATILRACPDTDGAQVRAQADFTYAILGPIASAFGGAIGGDGTLETEAVMRCGG